MAHINRRTVLRLTGGSAIAAKTGGIAAILASGRAPAFAQAATVHWLRWADFVPASDVLLKGEITAECQKAARHQADGRDDQRQRHPGARHLVDPVGGWRRHRQPP